MRENGNNMKHVRDILTFIGCLTILVFVYLGTKDQWLYISEGVLGITAVIILWYTWETSKTREANEIIAKASKEASEKNKQPIVGYKVYTHPDYSYDTRFQLINQSIPSVPMKVRHLPLDKLV